jgi:hypothetical protein
MSTTTQTNTYAARQRHRDRLAADVIQQARNAVDDLLARTPEEWGEEITQPIEGYVMARTRLAVESMDLDELRSDFLWGNQIDAARADARRLIRLMAIQFYGVP